MGAALAASYHRFICVIPSERSESKDLLSLATDYCFFRSPSTFLKSSSVSTPTVSNGVSAT